MVLMVPDDDTDIEESAVEAPEGEAPKAELDTEELTQDLPKENQKVELDLEDAPFLDDDDDDEEEEEEQEEVSLEEPAPEGELPWFKNKKIVIPAGAALLAVISALIIWLYTSPDPEPVAEPVEDSQTLEGQEAAAVPEEPEIQEYLVTLAPFWVEQKDKDDEIRFLVCQFTAVTENEKLSFELKQKTTILRDAVFYYLKNKSLTYLADKTNAEALKADVLSVINQYLSVDRLETLLIEQYLVK